MSFKKTTFSLFLKRTFSLLIFIFLIGFPLFVFAQSSNNLLNQINQNSGFSGSTGSSGSSDATSFFERVVPSSTFGGTPLSNLLNQIFYIGLAVAVVLAIVMIIRGGIQYMTIDAATNKDSGKKMVQAALGGLILAFAAILILNTINKNITSFTLSFDPLDRAGTAVGSSTPLAQGTRATTTQGVQVDPTTGRITNTGLTQWGDPSAQTMQGQTVSGRQTYFASGETVSDSNTDAGLGARGPLIEGTSNTVGSAGSNYYPAGTLIRTNGGILYVIDDNNFISQSDGSLRAANNNVMNNYTVDIYTTNVNQANTGSTNNNIEILYVPPSSVNAAEVRNIRNNPYNYIGRR